MSDLQAQVSGHTSHHARIDLIRGPTPNDALKAMVLMFAIFRLFSMLSTVIAFLRTPAGRQMTDRARAFLSNPANQERAATLAGKVRQPRRTQS